MSSVASSPSPSVSHEVLPAGSQPRGVLRWGYFLVLNAIAAVAAVGIFISVFYADALDPYMRGTYSWLLERPTTSLAGRVSPHAMS